MKIKTYYPCYNEADGNYMQEGNGDYVNLSDYQEKEKDMLRFTLWYSDPLGRGFIGKPEDALPYWKENVDGKTK